MPKLNTLDVDYALSPFKTALGPAFEKVSRDIKSLLGRVEKDMIIKGGTWKATTTFKLKSSDGYTLQLPPNHPASIILCFGMRLNEIADSGEFQITATIPKDCMAWVEQHSKVGVPA